jgi:hypothetical protein
LARSLDGGITWKIEDPTHDGRLVARGSSLHGTEPYYPNRIETINLAEPIDFSRPDFAMTLRYLNHNTGPSVFYYSYDRGHFWHGPFKLEISGKTNILARTDYIVLDHQTCLAFLSQSKENNKEGSPICTLTLDGGLTWQLVSMIGPEPQGFGIMPSSIQLSDNEFLTTIIRREDTRRWIDAWSTKDAGKSWALLAPPIDDIGEGNPPSLIKLMDDRICLNYGVRGEPYGIAAKLSEDGGNNCPRKLCCGMMEMAKTLVMCVLCSDPTGRW